MIYTGSNNEEQLKKISDNINIFTVSTGIPVRAVDRTGKDIFKSSGNDNGCAFCNKLTALTGIKRDCVQSHQYGCLQAERFGGTYIYFCPAGITFFASPVILSENEQISLIGGPVSMIDIDDYIYFDIKDKYKLTDEQTENIKQELSLISYVSPERVNMLSKLLFITAYHISGIDCYRLFRREEEYLQQGKINDIVQSIKSSGNETKYPFEKENELLKAITEGDRPTAGRLLNEILGHLYFDGSTFEVIKARVIELVVLLSRAAVTGGACAEEILGLNYRYLKEVDSLKSIVQMSVWLTDILNRFNDCVFTLTEAKHSDIIFKAISYIKLNYMKRLTLEDVAKEVYLSPSYLSKVFAKEMNCNFITYLNRIRIEKGKALLLSDNYSLSEISEAVGYDNQSYFSKVFKKTTGITPGKFKETRGKALL